MWYQLQIEPCPRDKAPFFCDLLENAGALSLTLRDKNDDAILEPEPGTTPLWPELIIEALFQEEKAAEAMQHFLISIQPEFQIVLKKIREEKWEQVCRDNFQPKLFGKKLWICPSWVKPPEPDACNLILDPGLAFGTGSHPTTSLCLQWLDSQTLDKKTLIDYGCGSGILGLAALKLGASKVYAVDLDPQALIATQDNALRNQIGMEQLWISNPIEIEAIQTDIIIANILLKPLMSLESDFYKALQEDGILVVSGILKTQKDALVQAYENHFELIECQALEDWCLLGFKKSRSRDQVVGAGPRHIKLS